MSRFSRRFDLAKFLIVQRLHGFDVPHDPHFDEQSTAFFTERLRAAKSYLEYGSGGSTLLADRLGVPTLSIESDRYFARSVARSLSPRTNVIMHPVNVGLTGFWGTPVFRRPSARRLRRWRGYIDAPFQGDSLQLFPDFVLIDGRFRRACALKVASEAQRRGSDTTIMVDDYFVEGRTHLTALEAFLGSPLRQGRAAIFSSVSEAEVPQSAIEDAARDLR